MGCVSQYYGETGNSEDRAGRFQNTYVKYKDPVEPLSPEQQNEIALQFHQYESEGSPGIWSPMMITHIKKRERATKAMNPMVKPSRHPQDRATVSKSDPREGNI